MDATRRQFIKTIMVTAGIIGVFGPSWGNAADATALANGFGSRRRSRFFPQSLASGDPKPTSVILWTRVVDAEPSADRVLRLQVAKEDGFQHANLVADTRVTARAEHEGCVRVKVTGLEPGTIYYYRFIYRPAFGLPVSTNVGRTKTAPEVGDERPISFAFASCQDFVEKYYNSYLPLLTDEALAQIDFVVHLGDIIYETTRDQVLQPAGCERRICFRDETGAIDLSDVTGESFAARSLDNYRQLHQTYRSDVVMQAVLESYPLIAIWDDHEFSDDSWQDHATYLNDRDPDLEQDTERKQNAEAAWLEYLPIDDSEDDFTQNILGPDLKLYPNTRIYRALRFGTLLELILTDYRTFRPNHVVDEGAFPGAIFVTEQVLRDRFGNSTFDRIFIGDSRDPLLARFQAVVHWDDLSFFQQLVLIQAFTREYREAGYLGDPEARAREVLSGKLDADYLNLRLLLFPFLKIDTTGLPRGVAIRSMNKLALFSALGARYGTDRDFFDLFVKTLTIRDQRNQNAYGAEQEQFLRDALTSSKPDAAWKVVANAVSSTAMIVDLTDENLEANLGPGSGFPNLSILAGVIKHTPLAKRYYMRLDQWDGLPDQREALLDFYRVISNGNSTVVLIAGDIHASSVTDHSSENGHLFEFTGTSISAITLADKILEFFRSLGSASASQVSAEDFLSALGVANQLGDRLRDIDIWDGELRLPNVPEGLGLSELLDEIVRALDLFLIDRTPASLFWDSLSKMRIEDLDTHRNGIVVADVTAQEFQTTYFLIEPSVVSTPLYDPDDPDTIESAVHAYFALPVGVRQEGGLRETRRFGVETGGGSGIRRLDDIDGG